MTDPMVRPIVNRFAWRMECCLKANEHKGNWKGEQLSYLLRRLLEEAGELAEAATDESPDPLTVEIEAADVGNLAMMIADVCGGLKAGEEE